uniref:PGMC2 n=1 Tax=Arundo donax TaxID=35708 RepID=A0A0A9E0E5_ARUDO
MPKSSVGPPGLWLAVKMKAPVAFDPSAPILSRMTADTAGVDMRLFCPTQTRLTPLAAAIFVMI